MTVRDTAWSAGTPCWMDLMTPDTAGARSFYGALFGWEFDETGEEFGGYLVARKSGYRVAGVGSPPDPAMPAAWATYLASTDADATSAAIIDAGGAVFAPPMDIGDEGRMLMAADPTGAAFGVWQARNHTGAQLVNEPGSFTWNECMTRDFPAAQAFYSTVFGYDWQDLSNDGFTYATPMVDGRPVGGLGGLPAEVPAEVPSHWMGYFKVEDARAAAERVTELGGAVQREPWESPFGTIASVADPSGAPFNVMADNDESRANAAAAAAE